MNNVNVTDRIKFLAEKFDVFDDVGTKLKELKLLGFESQLIENGTVLLAISSTLVSGEKTVKRISVSIDVFSSIISADPTMNKSCVQWMLNVFVRYIREGGENIILAIRFVSEDLPQASMFLTLFESNKRKKKFKELCLNSYILKHVVDPTDINQYKSLSQLFDAVDPFIERDSSAVERLMQRFVDAGQAEIPVRDRKFTVFIPKTRDANVIFGNFANWCTAREDNGMFSSYTQNHRKPNGKKSDIYIIINNDFFVGKSDEVYQIHFETNQLKDRHNSSNVSIFETVINESIGLSNFFYSELIQMAKECKTGLVNNLYLDFLIRFGFCDSLFELVDNNTPTIRFMNREIPKLPDLSRFKELDQLIITGANLVMLHPSIGKLKKLEMLVLTDNRIKSLPSEIGQLNKLTFLNIIGNPIVDIPNEITYLDRSNGGSLFRLAVRESEIGKENYKKLKELLPTTKF